SRGLRDRRLQRQRGLPNLAAPDGAAAARNARPGSAAPGGLFGLSLDLLGRPLGETEGAERVDAKLFDGGLDLLGHRPDLALAGGRQLATATLCLLEPILLLLRAGNEVNGQCGSADGCVQGFSDHVKPPNLLILVP